jgi:VIT1/CCC1 family predicted Fe2+/Mn2+ transporter
MKQIHIEKHFQQSAVLQDIVIGLADGLTVPFALAAGLSAAVSSNNIILTAGIAEIIAGSIAMGLGGYLSGKTEIEHYDSELKREYREIKEFNETEKKEVREIFAGYGLSSKVQDLVAEELSHNDDKWVDFMMRFELGLEKPDAKRAAQSARNIGLSYIAGGIVPLTAYMFTTSPHQGLLFSSIITVIFLFVFGYFKSSATGQPPIKGAFKTMVIGVIAAAAAFFIARLFS